MLRTWHRSSGSETRTSAVTFRSFSRVQSSSHPTTNHDCRVKSPSHITNTSAGIAESAVFFVQVQSLLYFGCVSGQLIEWSTDHGCSPQIEGPVIEQVSGYWLVMRIPYARAHHQLHDWANKVLTWNDAFF